MAHGRGRFGKKIDTVHWISGQFSFITQGAGTVAGTLAAAQHLPETLMRTRGEWYGGLDGPQAAKVGTLITIGMIQVPEGTGTTVLWSPFTDSDAPWIWWDTAMLIYEEMVTDVAWNTPGTAVRRVVDSKAMRKLRNTELQLVLESTTISGITAADIDVNFHVRLLAGT